MPIVECGALYELKWVVWTLLSKVILFALINYSVTFTRLLISFESHSGLGALKSPLMINGFGSWFISWTSVVILVQIHII